MQTSHEPEKVAICFAGDSGDGMQLTGSLFSDETALFGNDLATFPDYPAEIRAPTGTVAGVSSFQVQFGSVPIHTPGDLVDVLIAMNPAALKANLPKVRPGGIIVVDQDQWEAADLSKADYVDDPLKDETLENYRVIEAPITTVTRNVLKESDLDTRTKDRSRNMFALGMMFWLYSRPLSHTEKYLRQKFKAKPRLIETNLRVLQAGFDYAQTVEAFASPYKVSAVQVEHGLYRQVTGNQAVALGMIAASVQSGRKLVLGSYPITPASDILHELSLHKEFGVKTIQAEDEIAGICIAIGASYAGALALTTTSGPGLDLKSEAIGLAVMAELPLVIVNVQRGGPSTGLPTKTEQSDLLQALYGRHGECPLPILAASTPGDCFDFAFEASRIALEHMTPIILLTDGYLANGSEPWKVPQVSDLPTIGSREVSASQKEYQPYRRDPKTLVREWALPGTHGMEHRIGGLEKQETTGTVSYDHKNHEKMVRIRAEKVARIADRIPKQKIHGPDHGDLLVVGWGGTYGSLMTAVTELGKEGQTVSLTHLRYLNPLPKNLGEVFKGFKKIVVCELNLGQLHRHLVSCFPWAPFQSYTKIQGIPFSSGELKDHFKTLLATGAS